MANKIQIRRGLKNDLPSLSAGEPAYTTDTHELYIGTGSGNVRINRGRTAIVIGRSDSMYGAYADYICDGSNDTEIFQQAINTLPQRGGTIIVLEGEYTITSKLTANKTIVVKGVSVGTGAGTVINCTNHAFVHFTASINNKITIENIMFMLTGTLTGDYFIKSTGGDVVVDNCIIYTLTTDISQENNTNYIHVTGDLTVINSDILIMIQVTSPKQSVSFVGAQQSGKKILISNCNIELHNLDTSSTPDTSTYSSVLNAYILRDGGTIDNCNITCKGAMKSDIKATACIVGSGGTIVNCPNIDIKNVYASVTGNLTIGSVNVAEIVGKHYAFLGNAVYYSSPGTLVSFARVTGNYFESADTSARLCFNGGKSIVAGNIFKNKQNNDIMASGTCVFTCNSLEYPCEVNTSASSFVESNITTLN